MLSNRHLLLSRKLVELSAECRFCCQLKSVVVCEWREFRKLEQTPAIMYRIYLHESKSSYVHSKDLSTDQLSVQFQIE